MKKRDLDILNSLEKFKCLSSSQIAALHFTNNANPKVSANRVLKRLRQSEHILANTDRSFQEYVYFLDPSPIKTDSQKIEHYLMIAQTVIDMQKYSLVNDFAIEKGLPETNIIPDIQVRGWMNNDWYIECQNSTYTVKQLYQKLDKYADYHRKGYWQNERVLIVGKVNLNIDHERYPFKIKQVKCVDDLNLLIQQIKERDNTTNIIKSVNGAIKFVL